MTSVVTQAAQVGAANAAPEASDLNAPQTNAPPTNAPPTITGLTTRLLTRPLPRPWGPDVTELHVIGTRVSLSDGSVGEGFTWTPTIGARAAQALLDHDIAPFAVGRSAHPEALWDALWVHLHEAGGGGLTTIAMAGLDLALWDALATRQATSVHALLGGSGAPLPTYGSGVNLHLSTDDLVAQVQRWVDAGHSAIKLKVGSPDLARDVQRLTAVRDVLGPDRELMLDANQRWDLGQARRALAAFEQFNPAWIEEPLRANDLTAHRALRGSTQIPVALGENLHTVYQFRDFLEAGVVDIAQPNVVRVGGITPFRRIAALARAYSVELAPHLLTDLSALVAPCVGGRVRVEEVEDASFGHLDFLAHPSPVERSLPGVPPTVTVRPHVGLGLVVKDNS